MLSYLRIFILLSFLTGGAFAFMNNGQTDKPEEKKKGADVSIEGPGLQSVEIDQMAGTAKLTLATSGYMERSMNMLY